MPKRTPTEKNPNGCTGPTSTKGKNVSRANSTKHGGCCSSILILPNEDPADFEKIAQDWKSHFEPDGVEEEALVDALILNDWSYRRARRNFFEAEAAAAAGSGPNPVNWSPEQQHHVALMQRYKTAAERAFYRSLNALRALRKDLMNENLKLLKSLQNEKSLQAEIEQLQAQLRTPEARAAKKENAKTAAAQASEAAKTPAQRLFRGQLNPKKRRKVPVLDQWVEVEVIDGKTVTTLYPSNENLIKRGQAMLPPPELVYRRMNFIGGVPSEYFWTTADPVTRNYGGQGIQRMEVDVWLQVIEKEKLSATGHIGPTGVGNLPRPMDRGGCDCETCTQNRSALEASGGLKY